MSETLDGWPTWLRWVLFAPAGLLAGLLVLFPIHWVVLLATSGGSDDGSGLALSELPPETLERGATALLVPMTIIFVASQVAPTHKTYVAGVLAVGWALLLGVVLTVAAQSGSYQGSADWAEFVAVVTLGVTGTLVGFFTAYQEEQSARA